MTKQCMHFHINKYKYKMNQKGVNDYNIDSVVAHIETSTETC